MASTYSNLKIQLMATGENSGTWGNVTNVNLGTAIEQAMVETATVTFASANVTLTLTDTNAAQNARALRLNLTGTTGGARDLIVPAVQKPYIVNNGTADTITVKVSGQTGIAVPASKTMLVYNNGTDVVDAINHLSALSLTTALPIASGGTGSTSTTYANLESNVSGTLPVANGGTSATTLNAEAVVIGNATGAVKFVAPGTDGNVLTSNGTAWVSEAIVIPPSVPTGTIAAFAGDPGAGWLECNGQVVSQSTYSDLYAKVGLIVDGMQTTTAAATIYGSSTYPWFSTVAYGNSTYVVGCDNPDLAYQRNFTSTDAVTWTARSVGWVAGVNGMRKVVYGDKFVATFNVTSTAGVNRNNVATSTDGITWTTRTFVVETGIPDIVYGNSIYLAASNTGAIGTAFATSTDGITWTARTAAVTVQDSRLAYGNGVFVSVAAGAGSSPLYKPVIQTSTDGITWTYRSTGIRVPVYRGITFDGDKFWMISNKQIVCDGTTVITSTDGITWNLNTTLPNYMGTPESIGYDSVSDILIVVTAPNSNQENSGIRYLTSKDKGLNWSISTPSAVLIGPTTTSGQQAPGPQSIRPIYPWGVGSANGKLFLCGYNRTNSGSSTNSEYYNAVLIIRDPYSYQTDTQFVVPYATGISGITTANQVSGLKSSYATLDLSGNGLKYFIKT